jgi:hypothetical protein
MVLVSAITGWLCAHPRFASAENLHTHTTSITRVGINVGSGDLYVQMDTALPSSWTTCATNLSYVKLDLDAIEYPDGVLAMLYSAVDTDKQVSFVVGDGSTSCYGDSANFKSVYLVR